MSEYITPPRKEFTDPGLPTVLLVGHQRDFNWQEELARQLIASGFPINVASTRRPDVLKQLTHDTQQTTIEDAAWGYRNILRTLGSKGVVAVNLIPRATGDSTLREGPELTALHLALLASDPAHYGNVVIRVAPKYRDNSDLVGALQGLTGKEELIREQGGLITEILTRLPAPTRSIPS